MTAIRHTDAREVGAGILFLLLGVVVVVYAHDYELGTATKMGPGYFPTLLGGLLVLLGGTAVFQGLRRPVAVAIGTWPVVPAIFLLAGVLAFAWLIGDHGLIPSVVAATLFACYGRLRHRPVEVAAITAVLVALTTGVFYYGIQLPFRLW